MADLLPVPETPEVPAVVDTTIPTTTVDTTTAPEPTPATAAPSLRDALSDVFEIPENVSDDDFKNQMLRWYEQSAAIGSDDINQLRQAAAQYQQIAPQLTEFQKWQQERAQAAEPPKQDEWAMPELSAVEQSLIQRSDNGRFVPVEAADPTAVAAAAKANQRVAIQESIAHLATTNPREFAKRALQEELDRREAAIIERLQQFEQRFEQQVTPLQYQQQQLAAQAEFDAFVEANSSLLLKPAADGNGFVWSDAAGVFGKEYESLVSRGVDVMTARDVALRLASASASTPATPAAPAAPAVQPKAPSPQRAAVRAIDLAKARVQQAAGEPVVPTGRARTLSQLVEAKSREFAARTGAT